MDRPDMDRPDKEKRQAQTAELSHGLDKLNANLDELLTHSVQLKDMIVGPDQSPPTQPETDLGEPCGFIPMLIYQITALNRKANKAKKYLEDIAREF